MHRHLVLLLHFLNQEGVSLLIYRLVEGGLVGGIVAVG